MAEHLSTVYLSACERGQRCLYKGSTPPGGFPNSWVRDHAINPARSRIDPFICQHKNMNAQIRTLDIEQINEVKTADNESL